MQISTEDGYCNMRCINHSYDYGNGNKCYRCLAELDNVYVIELGNVYKCLDEVKK